LSEATKILLDDVVAANGVADQELSDRTHRIAAAWGADPVSDDVIGQIQTAYETDLVAGKPAGKQAEAPAANKPKVPRETLKKTPAEREAEIKAGQAAMDAAKNTGQRKELDARLAKAIKRAGGDWPANWGAARDKHISNPPTARHNSEYAAWLDALEARLDKLSNSADTKPTGYPLKRLIHVVASYHKLRRATGVNVRFVKTAAEVGKAPGTKGFANEDGVVLIADHITDDADARAVFLHEMGVHVGMTPEEIEAWAKEVHSWGAAAAGSQERHVHDAVMGRLADAEVTSDEELVAYATEEAAKIKASPLSAVGRWVAKLLRALAAKLGFPQGRLTPQDLVAFAYGAAHRGENQMRMKRTPLSAAIGDALRTPQEFDSIAGGLKMLAKSPKFALNTLSRSMDIMFKTTMQRITKSAKKLNSKRLEGMTRLINKQTVAYHNRVAHHGNIIREMLRATVLSLGELHEKNPTLHKAVRYALLSNDSIAELRTGPKYNAVVAGLAANGGAGWKYVHEARAASKALLKYANDHGLWFFESKDIYAAIMGAEPVHFGRNMDVELIKEDEGGFAEAAFKAAEGKVTMEQVLAWKNGIILGNRDNIMFENLNALLSGEKLKDRLNEVVKKSQDDMERLIGFTASAVGAKNPREMSDKMAWALRKFATRDLGGTLTKNGVQIATRIAQHETMGGFISANGKRFLQYGFEMSAMLRAEIGHQKKIITERGLDPGKEHSEMWYEHKAREKIAEKGQLTYSPIAGAVFNMFRISDESVKVSDPAGHRELIRYLKDVYYPAQFGQLGQNIDPDVRSAQEMALFALRAIMLPLAMVSSIVEVGSVGVAWSDPALQRGVAHGVGKAMYQTVKMMMNHPSEAEESFLRMSGVIHDAILAQDFGVQAGEHIRSAGLKKWSARYYQINGLNWWTNTVGRVAHALAEESLAEYVADGSPAALRALDYYGVTAAQWEDYVANPLARDADMQTRLGHMAMHKQAYQAVNTWINSARLRPTAATKTGYSSDPRFALLTMLTDFPQTFGAVTMGRLWGQAQRNPNTVAKMLPMLMAGIMFTLLGMLALVIKDLLKSAVGREPPKFTQEDFSDLLLRSFLGAGNVFGYYDRIAQAMNHAYHDYQGNPLLMNFFGPVGKLFYDINARGTGPAVVGLTPLPASMKKDFTVWWHQIFGV
jgi:hypothetical protein